MATLTIELPETPQAQPAYRLAADCPHCGAPLVLRQNRQTGVLFTGCSAYPGCAFTEPHDSRVQTLSTGLVQAVQTLATQVVAYSDRSLPLIPGETCHRFQAKLAT